MNRRERLEQMGEKIKKFNNVYVKNFGDEYDDVKLKELFENYGKIISAKVLLLFVVACLFMEVTWGSFLCQLYFVLSLTDMLAEDTCIPSNTLVLPV